MRFGNLDMQSAMEIVSNLHKISHAIGPVKITRPNTLAQVIAEYSYGKKFPSDPVRHSSEMYFETEKGLRIMVEQTRGKKIYFEDCRWFPEPQHQGPIVQPCDYILFVMHSAEFRVFSSIMISWEDIPQFMNYNWTRCVWHTYLSKSFLEESDLLLKESYPHLFL